jgi:trehalose synthase
MLVKIKTGSQKINKYKKIISPSLLKEINSLSEKLKGLKVIHINSTPEGGGVAEILKSLVPLMKGSGLKTSWHTIPPEKEFFNITKTIHNTLQGGKESMHNSFKRGYLDYMEKVSFYLKDMKADVWILHDPQPAGLADFLPRGVKISRIHVDSSKPNKEVWDFLQPFLTEYDKVIFSSKEFIGRGLSKTAVFPPAINPFTEKNRHISQRAADNILRKLGINPKKRLIVQVARFDLFKDPLGVIKAYKIVKKNIPDLQLAFAGLILADDDPEALKVLRQVKKAAGRDKDIFLFSDPSRLKNLSVDNFVNACQTGADIVLQKSVKEGFGLSVTEAMWKAKPVIGGNVGGIKLQIKNGKNGFLVSSVKEAAERITQLLKNKKLAERLGLQARITVQQKFLMPRLLRDYLKLFVSLT